MMTRAGPLRWAEGAGWLVLVGGDHVPQIGDRVLGRADFARPVAVVPSTAGLEWGEALLETIADLGGPRGYVVPLQDREDALSDRNRDLIAEAGLIVLSDGDAVTMARLLRDSPLLQGMAEAYAQGAIVVGVGTGAVPLGEWVLHDLERGKAEQGWGWISAAVIVPRFAGAEGEPHLRALLRRWPGILGLGIPDGAALALGPGGQVETWGQRQVTVVVAAY